MAVMILAIHVPAFGMVSRSLNRKDMKRTKGMKGLRVHEPSMRRALKSQ
jgi:hypothetical protein